MRRRVTRGTVGHHERGDVLVSVALALPVLMLFMALVIDVGNWFEHRRHIQFQSYAAAFAGGALFQKCISPDAGIANDGNTRISNAAQAYGGDPAYVADPTDPEAPPVAFNKQIGGSNQGAIAMLLNSNTYSPGGSADDTVELPPCDAKMLDVKMKEDGLPVFFSGILPFLDPVNLRGHARVEIQKVYSQNDVRPIAIRDDPSTGCNAESLLVNTESGATETIELAQQPPPSDGSYVEFKSDPTEIFFGPGHLRVRVRLDCGGTQETFAESQVGPAGEAVNYINVYSTGAAPLPVVRSVRLEGGACQPDVYFFTNSCFVTAKADVEFQDGAVESGDDPNVFVWIEDEPADFQGGDTWARGFPVSAQSGPQLYSVRWKQEFGSVDGKPCGDGAGTNPVPCEGTFGLQQQAYAATDDDSEPSNSGDLILVKIDEPSNPGADAHSFPKNPSRTLVFTVRVRTLSNSKPTDEPIVLRFPPSGSRRTGAVVCGPVGGAAGAFDNVINGCPRSVATWLPGSDCATVANSDPPTPITCVEAIHPGNLVEAVKIRVGASCNNWNAYRDSGTPIPQGDPRALTVIVTPPNSNLSGNLPPGVFWPVRRLGTFYVTGFAGSTGSGVGCDNEPFAGSTKNAVWGHWIKYVVPSSSGTGATDPFDDRLCQFEQFGNCTPVLTR